MVVCAKHINEIALNVKREFGQFYSLYFGPHVKCGWQNTFALYQFTKSLFHNDPVFYRWISTLRQKYGNKIIFRTSNVVLIL